MRKKIKRRFVGLIILIIIFLLGLILLIFFQSKKRLSSELNIYNWEDYLAPEVIEGFEKEFGVKINVSTYDDEFIMLDEYRKNPDLDKYDLVVGSDAVVGKIIEENLALPIDEKNIPNMKNIESVFKDTAFNAQKTYVVPYNWGTTGILINTKFISNVDSWGVFWNSKYSGKMCILNDPAEITGMAAKYLGFSVVPQSEKEMKEIREKMLEQKKISGNYCDYIAASEDVISGKLWVVQEWSGRAAQVIQKNPDLKYVIPKEGGAVWIDTFFISKNAKSKYTAEVFLNYLNRPEVNAKNVNYLKYPSCNSAAKEFINKDILNNEVIYPTDEIRKRLDPFINHVNDKEIFEMRNELWQELTN